MPRIRYTDDEKIEALRLCDQMGVTKTSEQTGISINSLYKWRSEYKDFDIPVSPVIETPPPIKDEAVPVYEAAPADEAVPVNIDATPVKEAVAEKYTPYEAKKTEPIGENRSEEVIWLRVENKVLKEQMVALKTALRAFTE